LPRSSHPSARPALKPRGFALPVAPPDEAASCPAPCIFGFCRRPSFELPRPSCPSALPVVKLRLPRTPLLRLRLSMHPPGRPGFCIFRPCRRWIFELPRISHPSAHRVHQLWVAPQPRAPGAPADESPGLPRHLHLPALPATDLRVAPNLASFGTSGAVASGCPSASRFQLRLPVRLRVSPHSAPSGFASGLSLRVAPNPRSFGAG